MDWSALQSAGAFAKGVGSGAYAGGKSLLEGLGTLAQAGWKTATDGAYRDQVFDRAQQLASSAKNFGARAYDDPGSTAQATWAQAKGLGSQLKQQYVTARNAAEQQGRLADFYGEVVGRGGFEAAALFVPVSKLGALGKAGTAAKTADVSADAARLASRTGVLAEEATAVVSSPVASKLKAAANLEKSKPLPAPSVVTPCVRSTNPTLAKLHLEHADEIASGKNFVTKGIAEDQAMRYLATPDGVAYLQALRKADPKSAPDALVRRAIAQLQTGSALPSRIAVTEPLVKIVPEGAFKPYTPFWTTEAELQKAVASGKPLNEVFGLPMTSDAVQYRVVRSTPPKGAEAWVHGIAPTRELGIVEREGGAIQSLIPDRSGWVDDLDAFAPLDNLGGRLVPKTQ